MPGGSTGAICRATANRGTNGGILEQPVIIILYEVAPQEETLEQQEKFIWNKEAPLEETVEQTQTVLSFQETTLHETV